MTTENHSVWTRTGPVILTDAQEDARERFKAHVAAELMGAEWTSARAALEASGLDHTAACETLLDAVNELIDDGVDEYRATPV